MISRISHFWCNARCRNIPAALSVFMACIALAACNNDGGRISVSDGQASMVFTAPAILLQSRRVVPENLVLEVSIDGQQLIGQQNALGEFIFRTTVAPNTSAVVLLEWFETIPDPEQIMPDQKLRLATANRELFVGSGSSLATIRFDAFNTSSSDVDEDGFSNLVERQTGSDVNDPNDPVMPPVFVDLTFQFELPVELESAAPLVRSQVSAEALVNDVSVPLTREGDVWRGVDSVTEDSDPLVTAIFFATEERTLQLATLLRSENVGSGANFVFEADSYEVDPFNDDGDDFNNAEEIARGSNPFDSLDPDGEPEADAGPDQTVTDGAVIRVDGSGSADGDVGIIVSYRWSEAGVLLATGETATLPSLSVGRHVVDLEVTDDEGDVATDSLIVTVVAIVVPNVPPTAAAGSNQTVDFGTVVTVDGSDSEDGDAGTIVSYRWSENGVLLATGETTTLPSLSVGTHTIELEVTDDDGDTDTDSLIITVEAVVVVVPNVPPTAAAGPNQTVDFGTVVTVDGSDSEDGDAGTIVSYRWSENGVLLATGETTTLPGLSVGTHTIGLEVTDDDGGKGTDSLIITVEAVVVVVPNVPPEADAGPSVTVDFGTVVTVDGSGSVDVDGGTIVSFEWREGLVVLASGEIATLPSLSVGRHVIELTVTDDDGDTGTDRLLVTVEAAVAPNEPPVAAAGLDQMLDEGDVLVLDGSNSTDDGVLVDASFEWFDGTTLLDTGETAMVAGLPADDYLVRLVVTDSEGETATDELEVSIVAAAIIVPNVLPVAAAGMDQTIMEGEDLILDGSGSNDSDGMIVSYAWADDTTTFGTGISTTTGGLPAGVYLIELTVIDDVGGIDTDEVEVTVVAVPVVVGPVVVVTP